MTIPGWAIRLLAWDIKGSRLRGVFHVRGRGRVTIGEGTLLVSGRKHNYFGSGSSMRLLVSRGAQLSIGKKSMLSNCLLAARKSITIGDCVLIGGGVQVTDSNSHSLHYRDRAEGDRAVVVAPVEICDHAFIGADSIILKGVTIGRGAVVGAGSVVTRSIPDGEIWGGNPAKKLKSLEMVE